MSKAKPRKVPIKEVVDENEAEKISDAADILVNETEDAEKIAIEKTEAEKTTAKKVKTMATTKTTVKKSGAKASESKTSNAKVKNGTKKSVKSGQSVSSRAVRKSKLVMDGMIRPSALENPTTVEDDALLEKDSEEVPKERPWYEELKAKITKMIADKKTAMAAADKSNGEPRCSRPKAFLLAVASAMGVGLIGGIVLWAINRSEIIYCKIEFESAGGTEVASQEVVCGSKITRPDDPAKEGFEFQDWLKNGFPFDFTRAVTESAVLTAKWLIEDNVEVITVTLDPNGGTMQVDELQVAKGHQARAPLNPKRSGYTFDAWYLGNSKYDFSTKLEKDITLVAHWIKNPEPEQESEVVESKDQNEIKVTGLTVSNVDVKRSNESGTVFEVIVGITPKDATFDLKVYSSSDGAVATCTVVDAKKNKLSCTALKSGTTAVKVGDTISGKTATFNIGVSVDATSVAISGVENNATVTVGQSLTLSAKVKPEDATDQSVVWRSTNTEVATVNPSTGEVQLVGVGDVTIRAIVGGKILGNVNLSVHEDESSESGGSETGGEGTEEPGGSEGEGSETGGDASESGGSETGGEGTEGSGSSEGESTETSGD